MIRRFLKHLLDATTPTNLLQVESLAGEVHNDVEELQPYGLASNTPPEVNEGLALFVNNNPDHGVCVGWFDRSFRPANLLAGEVIVYDKTGSTILLKSNGNIEITPSSGILKLNGQLQATGDVTAGTISLQNHGHIENVPSGVRTIGGAVA